MSYAVKRGKTIAGLCNALLTYQVLQRTPDAELRQQWQIAASVERVYFLVQVTTYQKRTVSFKPVAVFNLDSEAEAFKAWLEMLPAPTI